MTSWKIRFLGGRMHRCAFKWLLIQCKGQLEFKEPFLFEKQRGDFLGWFELFSWNFNIHKSVHYTFQNLFSFIWKVSKHIQSTSVDPTELEQQLAFWHSPHPPSHPRVANCHRYGRYICVKVLDNWGKRWGDPFGTNPIRQATPPLGSQHEGHS